MSTDYRIKIKILLTVHRSKSEFIQDRIQEEISILCSRLERLEDLPNSIFLSQSEIEANEYDIQI
jgi:hypothetical protein